MKKLLLSLAVLFFGAFQAHALTADTCMDMPSCTVGISADTGNTAKQCAGITDSTCSCAGQSASPGSCGYYIGTSCNSWKWMDMGPVATGQRCCMWYECARRNTPEVSEEIQQALKAGANLHEVFEPELASDYFGVVNLVNRSPNAGRSNALNARLDACLGYSNVDAFTDYRSCETACGDGSKNGYCQNSSNAVCIDRCQCKYPGNGTCDGL